MNTSDRMHSFFTHTFQANEPPYHLIHRLYFRTLEFFSKTENPKEEFLQRFPTQSLAYQLFIWQSNHQINGIPFQERCYYLLLGKKQSIKNDIQLRFLLIGNGSHQFRHFLLAFIGFVLLPKSTFDFLLAYQKGKSLKSFHDWSFLHLLDEDFDALLQFIHQNNPIFNIYL